MAVTIQWALGRVDENWNVIVSENKFNDKVWIRINNYAAITLNCIPNEWAKLVAYSEGYTNRVKFEQVRLDEDGFLDGAENNNTKSIFIRPFHEIKDQFFVELESGKFCLIDKEGVFFLVRVIGEGCRFYTDDFFQTKTTNADGSITITDMGDTTDKTPIAEVAPFKVEMALNQVEYHNVLDNHINDRFQTVSATLQCYNNKYAYTVHYNRAIEQAKTEYQKRKLEESNKLINAKIDALKKRREMLIDAVDKGIDTISISLNEQLVNLESDIESAYQTAISDAADSTSGLLAEYTSGIEQVDSGSESGSTTNTTIMRLKFFDGIYFDIGSGVDFDIFTGYLKMVIDKFVNIAVDYEYSYDDALGGNHGDMSANNPVKFYRYFDEYEGYPEPIPREMIFSPYSGYGWRIEESWNFKGIVWLLNKLEIPYYLYDITFDNASPTLMSSTRVLTEPQQFSKDDIIHIYKDEKGVKYIQRADSPDKYISLEQIKETYKIDLYSFMKSFGIPYEEMEDLIDVDGIGQVPENWKPADPVVAIDKNSLIEDSK